MQIETVQMILRGGAILALIVALVMFLIHLEKWRKAMRNEELERLILKQVDDTVASGIRIAFDESEQNLLVENGFLAAQQMRRFQKLTPAEQKYAIDYFCGCVAMVEQGFTTPHEHQAHATWARKEFTQAIDAARAYGMALCKGKA